MAKLTPPIIGINAGVRDIEGPGKLFFTLRTTYVDAVRAAGGIPVILPAVEDADLVAYHADLCDGFIFTGGPDLDPKLYGQEVHETVKNQLVEKRREVYDLALIHQVLDQEKPFLAICLGCQEVNVALGGTLIQDINSHMTTTVEHSKTYSRHDIFVDGDTKLASIIGEGTVLANTSHHQSIDTPGDGITVTSRCPVDGIIESFEIKDYPFGIALQWHPEMIYEEPTHLALFQALINAAKKH